MHKTKILVSGEGLVTCGYAAFVAAALTAAKLLGAGDVMLLLGGAFITIIGIVFGDDIKKLLSHERTETQDIFVAWHSVLAREAILPVTMLATLLLLGVVSAGTIVSVFADKIEILALIFSFAFISYGIGHAGYFKFAAFKIVEACNGNTARLALYLFIVTSILTFFTSNDIVVLVLTPIIVNVCFYSKIRNAKLLLLSQFIAANTLSMGLLVGSPTNIIVGFDQKINFIEYFVLMLLPAIASCLISFALINGLNLFFSENRESRLSTWWTHRIKDWQYQKDYVMPSLKHSISFSRPMKMWIGFFTALIIWLAIVSFFNWSLWWVTLPATAGSFLLFACANGDADPDKPAAFKEVAGGAVTSLPVPIFFFGMVYFIVAKELIGQESVILTANSLIDSLAGEVTYRQSLTAIVASGVLVNLLNDLPAAALLTEIISSNASLSEQGGFRDIIIVSILAGFNVGCYVTPIGALAGIIWFHQMRDEKKKLNIKDDELKMPTRSGLLLYGLLHFAVICLLLPLVIALQHLLSRFFGALYAGDWSHLFTFNDQLTMLIAVFGGVLIITHTLVTAARNRLSFRDLKVFLGFASWVSSYSNRYRVISFLILSGGLLWLVAFAAYNYELARIDSLPLQMRSFGHFFIWFSVFLGSGHSIDEFFPQTNFTMLITGILPIFVIFVIIRIFYLVSRNEGVQLLSERAAKGDIAGHRALILNYTEQMNGFIKVLLDFDKDITVALIADEANRYDMHDLRDNWIEEQGPSDAARLYCRNFAKLNEVELEGLAKEFHLGAVDELVVNPNNIKQKEIEEMLQVVDAHLAVAYKNGYAAIEQQTDPDGIGRLPKILFIGEPKLSPPAKLNKLIFSVPADKLTEVANAYCRQTGGVVAMKNAVEKAVKN